MSSPSTQDGSALCTEHCTCVCFLKSLCVYRFLCFAPRKGDGSGLVSLCCECAHPHNVWCRRIVTARYNREHGFEADCDVIYGDTDSVMVNFKVSLPQPMALHPAHLS